MELKFSGKAGVLATDALVSQVFYNRNAGGDPVEIILEKRYVRQENVLASESLWSYDATLLNYAETGALSYLGRCDNLPAYDVMVQAGKIEWLGFAIKLDHDVNGNEAIAGAIVVKLEGVGEPSWYYTDSRFTGWTDPDLSYRYDLKHVSATVGQPFFLPLAYISEGSGETFVGLKFIRWTTEFTSETLYIVKGTVTQSNIHTYTEKDAWQNTIVPTTVYPWYGITAARGVVINEFGAIGDLTRQIADEVSKEVDGRYTAI